MSLYAPSDCDDPYPESYGDGPGQCETCDKWIDGIGSNACVCCATCEGVGSVVMDGGDYDERERCTECNGTGRAKAVA